MIKTVSLETAKLLKEAGFRQDTSLYWINLNILQSHNFCLMNHEDLRRLDNEKNLEQWSDDSYYKYSAPITDELLEELPDTIGEHCLRICKHRDGFEVSYHNLEFCKNLEWDESLPEALAFTWLWLKKEGLLNAHN